MILNFPEGLYNKEALGGKRTLCTLETDIVLIATAVEVCSSSSETVASFLLELLLQSSHMQIIL